MLASPASDRRTRGTSSGKPSRVPLEVFCRCAASRPAPSSHCTTTAQSPSPWLLCSSGLACGSTSCSYSTVAGSPGAVCTEALGRPLLSRPDQLPALCGPVSHVSLQGCAGLTKTWHRELSPRAGHRGGSGKNPETERRQEGSPGQQGTLWQAPPVPGPCVPRSAIALGTRVCTFPQPCHVYK